MALSLSVLMAGAWMVQQHNGNSGWVDTIWTFAVGLVGVGGALWPVAGAAPHARQWLVAVLVAIWSVRLGLHIAVRTAGITDDPRYAASRQWGIDSPRRMFVFLQNQGFGSIPLVVCDFRGGAASGNTPIYSRSKRNGAGAARITSAPRSTGSPISILAATRSKAFSAASTAATRAFGCGAGAGSPRHVGIVRLRRRHRMGRQYLSEEFLNHMNHL
jgi:hypothetical protein